MPRRSLHNPDDDSLPAFGLREDALDDELKVSSLDERRGKQLNEFLRKRQAENERWQKINEGYGDELEDENEAVGPDGWRPRHRVSSTEVAAILVADLLRRKNICSNVNAWLAGHELTRPENRIDFPNYATTKLGFLPKAQFKSDWRGTYSMKGVRFKVALKHDKLDPCITVRLTGRKRLVIFFAGGSPTSTGHAEPGLVRELVGRAVCWPHAAHNDVFAIAVPRSAAFHGAVTRARNSLGAIRVGIHWLTVERTTGEVNGLDDVAGRLKARR